LFFEYYVSFERLDMDQHVHLRFKYLPRKRDFSKQCFKCLTGMWTRKIMRGTLTTGFPGTDNDVIASPSSAMAKASAGGVAYHDWF
jgi:hypothetical protein